MSLFHNSNELSLFKTRATDLYNPGSIFVNDPWSDVVTRANILYNDLFTDLWNADDITAGYADTSGTIPTNLIGHYTRDCAFYYLIKEDADYGAKAKASILAQVRNNNPVFEDYYSLSVTSALNLFHFAGVAIRFLLAFDYCRSLFSASEITEVESWMDRCYLAMIQFGDFKFYANFPNRDSRDYSVLGDYAASGQTYGGYDDTNPASWTHKDSGGTFQNRIYRITTDYNNQTALCNLFCGLWAIYQNDSTKIGHVKLFFEEFIKFGCFEDGTIGEYNRNRSGFEQLGTMWYSVITLECYVYFAEALRRTGDDSMYTFSTTTGYYLSEVTTGTSKNLKLLLDTLKSNITQSTVRYYSTVSDINKLDVLGGTNYRYTPELIFGISNIYYKDSTYTDTYLLNNSIYGYSGYGGPSYLSNARSINNTGILPAVPFYYEIEYPIANAGTNQSISVATSVLDGTASFDSDGTISTYLWEQISGPNTANILTPGGSTSIVNGMITGDYAFRLTVTDNDSLTDTDTVTITVNPVISTTNANARVLL